MKMLIDSGKKYLDDNFLLHNETAERLFHEVAKPLPIIDYHNHINAHHLSSDHKFENITDLWIKNDPYKHRAMRINGIPEQYITGNADPYEKFVHWAKTVPYTLSNPLFHWSSIELKRVFDIDTVLTEKNARDIWEHCNTLLSEHGYGASEIVQKCNAEIICTSDELLDELTDHQITQKKEFGFKVYPSLRCDKALTLDSTSSAYFSQIAESVGVPVKNLNNFKEALLNRIDYFDSNGCQLADHALDSGFLFSLPTEKKAELIFYKILKGELVSGEEVNQLRSHLLLFLGGEYGKRDWVMQLHVGAQRYTSSRLRTLAGPAGGFTCIGNTCDIKSLVTFLDTLEKDGKLPRTILYTLNPADNEAFASITGSFAEDNVPGKIQFGPAWWYNDHIDGIRKQLMTISSYGLLSRFIGMTTDSRSILSLYRHEYFRRICCNLIGEWVELGELPDDALALDRLVKDISYSNIKNWFQK
jgi:glucuronate isomerase